MATDLTAAPPAAPADDLGLDRAFVMSMARTPVIAVAWAAAAVAVSYLWEVVAPNTRNFGSLAVLCFGMILAAAIDGYAFKVPNWLTLSLTISGWYVGGLHDLGFAGNTGQGGVGQALLGTLVGFAALFPALAIGGMGQGDVKMTMGFGSWCGAYFGGSYLLPDGDAVSAAGMIWWSFCAGVIIGGVFGLVIMALRRQLHKNVSNFAAIAHDLQTLVTEGPGKAAERANSRRKDWVRLPYGVPLCVGFLGYLAYTLYYPA